CWITASVGSTCTPTCSTPTPIGLMTVNLWAVTHGGEKTRSDPRMSLAHINVDQDAVLKTLGLNPRDPNTQALLLICQRSGLDPLLKHIVLIQARPYVTRDGYLHTAHQAGKLDGIGIGDEGENATHWWAKAAVLRKDMQRPFTYRGRYPERGGNTQYGPEMAVKCAEVMALRRAFCVTGIAAADERWEDADGRISPQVA